MSPIKQKRAPHERNIRGGAISVVERMELGITRLGSQGDGVAETASGSVFVPFTLPGERVVADVANGRGALVGVMQPSPDRTAAICRHFGICGGCALQHLQPPAYLAWKQQKVADALERELITAPVNPIIGVPLASRRRAVFTAQRRENGIVLGFHRAGSHDLVAVEECPIMVPAIVEALPALRQMLSAILGSGSARVTVIAAAGGLDVAVDTQGGKRRSVVTGIPPSIARVTVDGEQLHKTGEPRIAVGGAAVLPPPGAFLQAVAEAQDAMISLVTGALIGAKNVADLYSGLGTFSLPLARTAKVTAVESDERLLGALMDAARRTPGLKPVTPIRRDLDREPLSALELKTFDAVVFDPPRAGAAAQAGEIARSKLKRAVGVSCNPATFARDARILIDGGFTLKQVTPIDQFLYSAHVEVVGVFVR